MGTYVPLPRPSEQPSYLQTLGQVYQNRDQQQIMQARAQSMQENDLKLQQERQTMADQQAVRQAYLDHAGQDGSFNQRGFEDQVLRTAPSLYQGVVKDRMAVQKDLLDQHKTQLANQKSQADLMGQLANSITDQNSYTRATQQAMQAGLLQPGEAPPIYDPNLVKQWQGAAQTVTEHLGAVQQAVNAAETARHNAAMEQNGTNSTAAQQAKAVSLYAKQKAGEPLTPAESNWLWGYEKYIKTTRTDPGVARAQVYVNAMPTQIVDPNDPTRIVYTTRKNAIGQEAPRSGDASAARSLTQYMTSGKGGQTLTAINTAQNHLDVLSGAARSLANGDMTAFNRIANDYAQATGSAAPTNFNAVKNAVKGEMAKALAGNVTVSEQAALDKDFNEASSPQQISGVVNKYKQLLEGKKQALQQQFQQGMQGKPAFDAGANSNLHWSQQSPSTAKPRGNNDPLGIR